MTSSFNVDKANMSRNTKTVKIVVVISNPQHWMAVAKDLHTRAVGALSSVNVEPQITLVTTFDSEQSDFQSFAVQVKRLEPLASAARKLALKNGPAGVVGRLVSENLESRWIAAAVRGDNPVRSQLGVADVVVAADVPAVRTVWKLRNNTEAALVQGPVAMVHFLESFAAND